jgi:hypothetical protein
MFVVMTSTLYHKGSHESKDNDEEADAALLRIEHRLEFLGAALEKFASMSEQQEFSQLARKVEKLRRRNHGPIG